jgi:tetratricopeptide (TPR) repeat protein
MATLPITPGPRETNPPWNVREGLLGSGRAAASLLGRWEDALDLNAGVIGSMLDRRAPLTTIARARYNDYYPLLRLGRADEALGLLQECHKAFKDANDIQMLGKTQSALASTEDIQGHSEAAIGLARDALRYKYLAGDVDAIAISHHNHGEYLRRAQHPASALANHLAAALIRTLAGVESTGDNSPADSARAAASDLLESRSRADPPRDILDLSEKLSDIPGTDLAGVIARLSPDPQVAEDTLQAIIAQVLGLAEGGQEVSPGVGMRRDAGAR